MKTPTCFEFVPLKCLNIVPTFCTSIKDDIHWRCVWIIQRRCPSPLWIETSDHSWFKNEKNVWYLSQCGPPGGRFCSPGRYCSMGLQGVDLNAIQWKYLEIVIGKCWRPFVLAVFIDGDVCMDFCRFSYLKFNIYQNISGITNVGSSRGTNEMCFGNTYQNNGCWIKISSKTFGLVEVERPV